jgi:hypothetical protein
MGGHVAWKKENIYGAFVRNLVKQHCLKIVGLALRVVTKQVERE